jgi:GTP-binding protein HflX
MIRVALTGYTNAGKSTIMNLISKSDVFAENKLFATLDTTVRKVVIDNIPFLLSDTVGFIRKLPHDLVESFKSTLDEVREADLLIHVVDISHPSFEDQINVVNQTLVDIKASDKPTILVFNKIDAYSFIKQDEDDLSPKSDVNFSLEDLKNSWLNKSGATNDRNDNPVIFVSAVTKENVDELKKVLIDKVKVIYFKRYPKNKPGSY